MLPAAPFPVQIRPGGMCESEEANGGRKRGEREQRERPSTEERAEEIKEESKNKEEEEEEEERGRDRGRLAQFSGKTGTRESVPTQKLHHMTVVCKIK